LSGSFLQASFAAIPFKDEFFDLVYSFGVLHHSEETQEGVNEIFRVLKPGGRAIVMLYHKGFKYYVRKLFLYGVLGREFLRYSAQEIVNRHSEAFGSSPLTKVYSRRDAAWLFDAFKDISLSCYRLDDYLKFGGRKVSPAQMFLPDRVYRWVEERLGWNLIIKTRKPFR
jgi:SAM-dependent methyltransferase